MTLGDFSMHFGIIFGGVGSTCGDRLRDRERENLRYFAIIFSKVCNAFFECDGNSVFRVHGVSIWLDYAFFGGFFDVFWCLGWSFLEGLGGHWRLLAPHWHTWNGQMCDFRSSILNKK